ncbi:MAG: hypothetical protein ACI4R9_03680 [Kiritimatiellia bacterium]
MTSERPFDRVLEEMWAIKREIAAEYPSLDAYFQSVLDDQCARARQGVKFVSFPPRRLDKVERRVRDCT